MASSTRESCRKENAINCITGWSRSYLCRELGGMGMHAVGAVAACDLAGVPSDRPAMEETTPPRLRCCGASTSGHCKLFAVSRIQNQPSSYQMRAFPVRKYVFRVANLSRLTWSWKRATPLPRRASRCATRSCHVLPAKSMATAFAWFWTRKVRCLSPPHSFDYLLPRL